MQLLLGFLALSLSAQTIQIGPASMLGPAQMGGAAAGVTHTFTFVQQANGNGNCSAQASCTATTVATSAGNLVVGFVPYANAADLTLSSVTCDNGGANLCTGGNACTILSAAHVHDSSNLGNVGFYCPNVPVAIHFIGTLSGSSTNISIVVAEYTCSPACSGITAETAHAISTGGSITATYNQATPTITGTSVLVVQSSTNDFGQTTSCGATYGHLTSGTNNYAAAICDLLNTTTTTPPGWVTGGNADWAVSEMAFK